MSVDADRRAAEVERLAATIEAPLARLEQARPFAKQRFQHQVLSVASRMFASPGGIAALYPLAARLDAAGIFAGSDWNAPDRLRPQLVGGSLAAPDPSVPTLEAVSLLRMLALAKGEAAHPGMHADHARHFLTQVLALNLRRLFGATDEAARAAGPREAAADALFRFLADHVGFQDVLGALVAEIWRIQAQRPIQVGAVKDMVAQIAVTLAEGIGDFGDARLGADRLVSALFGPTEACRDDPGLSPYRRRLEGMDDTALSQEARALARAMHDTGLVSDYHAEFLRWACEVGRGSVLGPEALWLGPTGLDCWRRHEALVLDLIARAVRPETSQTVHGLALMLERGVLHHPPVAPALRRQLSLAPSEAACAQIAGIYGPAASPADLLVAGVVQVLGQPLGVGQGANPTCQSARAIALWAWNDPDFLLHLVAQAARHDTVMMHFEGRPIASAGLAAGLAAGPPLDADPVSVLLVPHLDRIYAEMGRLCADRGEDPHVWINPEFHGWWVGRDCAVAVDVPTGALAGIEDFLCRFHLSYHPDFNGGEPVIHPQPAGVAVTDSAARFIGWHAIAILRVARDPDGAMRVYFYNPNNDSGQDWGAGVVVSTDGKGERHGEASLPFEQFAARLYLFHDAPVRLRRSAEPSSEAIKTIADAVRSSWAAGRDELSERSSPAIKEEAET